MDITQSKGNFVELQCLSAFIERGYECSIPYGNGAKYDFIVDYNGELLRIQCKSSSHPSKNGIVDTQAFQFYTCSQTTNTTKTVRHKYSSKDIDYFATYFNGQVYIIPVDECSTSKTLRFSPPNNGQVNNYNKAENYLISNFFDSKFDFDEKQKLKQFICFQCNKNIVSKEGGICHQCSSINKRPNREELKELIRTKSFLEIAKIYGVSDNAIRKWCDNEKLPRKKSEINKISDEDWKKI